MKKTVFAIAALLLLCAVALGAAETGNTDDWARPPVITKAYEQASEKVYIEWEGSAPVYQIHVDGKRVSDVSVAHDVLTLKKGTHTIVVYPIYEVRETDGNIDVNIGAGKISGGVQLDLKALGLDPKRLVDGTPSEKFYIDYKPSQIVKGTPGDLAAETDPDNRVVLSFTDQYTSDEYIIMVRHKNDRNYVTFRFSDGDESRFITKTNSRVSIVLDPEILRGQECMVPELNDEYRFSVQLRKYSVDLITGEKEKTVILDSKTSSELVYRVAAAWKKAPGITFASQTADGQITLQWDHEDYGLGCEYAVMKINKALGIVTGEEELGRTKGHEYVISDLTNGGYCIKITPVLNGEKGSQSAEANVDIKNEWVVAPKLETEMLGGRRVRLTWKASPNVESYHITVYTGDNNSLLRYVDLDYSKYTEIDVAAAEGEMEYIYTYDKEIDDENGLRMKFEICGIRHTAQGSEQKSAVSSKTMVLK